ncbi:hypothetical protein BKA70DRAFT_1216691 [Coprinopsis sp. MPI-PUGE-AT-0042]|nr:hypothetical protein BKA70DRAFT_1216691 [Coprinopsis sp. MPI-PUGE-AT-0042]
MVIGDASEGGVFVEGYLAGPRWLERWDGNHDAFQTKKRRLGGEEDEGPKAYSLRASLTDARHSDFVYPSLLLLSGSGIRKVARQVVQVKRDGRYSDRWKLVSKIDSWSEFPKLGVCADRPISGKHPGQKVMRDPQPGWEDCSPRIQERMGRTFWRPTSTDARVRHTEERTRGSKSQSPASWDRENQPTQSEAHQPHGTASAPETHQERAREYKYI